LGGGQVALRGGCIADFIIRDGEVSLKYCISRVSFGERASDVQRVLISFLGGGQVALLYGYIADFIIRDGEGSLKFCI